MRFLLAGILITLTFWVLSWTRIPFIYLYTFAPLWIGYILAVNGLSEVFIGTSLLSKMKKGFLFLFVISIPLWWFFELLNLNTGNWQYLFPRPVTTRDFFIRGSIAFSTVIPATLSTIFFFKKSLDKIKKFRSKRFSIKSHFLATECLLGIFSFALILVFPNFFFPLIWLCLFLVLDPVNYYLRFPSIIGHLGKGQWNIILAVVISLFFTGFLWEFWNYYSMPKWTYQVPYVGFFKVFEMPVLGFLGYPFFGLEIFDYCSLIFGLSKKRLIDLKAV